MIPSNPHPRLLTIQWPASFRLHRALHLVIASGLAAAGLCLVIGMIALTVWIGAKPGNGRFAGAHDVLNRVSGAAKPQPSLPANGNGEVAHARIVRFYHGMGPGQRGPFRIREPGRWGLLWAFSCGTGQDGQFLVTGRSPVTGNDIAVAASGPAARGISWADAEPGRHILVVHSGCSWQIKVLRPASRGSRRKLAALAGRPPPACPGR